MRVAEGSVQDHEHRTGSETLCLPVEYDQLDASNVAAVENLCHRQVQLELVVERCPSHPDFVGLSEIMGGPITEEGVAVVTRFREWVSGRQRERATILKQARLEREEREKPPTAQRDRPKAKANRSAEAGGC